MLARAGENHLRLQEVHRFPNRPLPLPDGERTGLHRDVTGLFAQVLTDCA